MLGKCIGFLKYELLWATELLARTDCKCFVMDRFREKFKLIKTQAEFMGSKFLGRSFVFIFLWAYLFLLVYLNLCPKCRHLKF